MASPAATGSNSKAGPKVGPMVPQPQHIVQPSFPDLDEGKLDPLPPSPPTPSKEESGAKEAVVDPATVALDDKAAQRLGKVVFSDTRWERGLKHLRESEPGWSVDSPGREARARSLLRKGAEAYGFWTLSDAAIAGLVNQLLELEGATQPSPGLDEWIKIQKEHHEHYHPEPDVSASTARHRPPAVSNFSAVSNMSTPGVTPSGPRPVSIVSPRPPEDPGTDEVPARNSGPLPRSGTAGTGITTGSSARNTRQSSPRESDIHPIEVRRFTRRHSLIAHAEEPHGLNRGRFGKTPSWKSAVGKSTQQMLHMKVPDWKGHFASPDYVRFIRALFHGTILIISAAYALDVVSNKYTDAMDMFSWPIFFARLGGMACALWTAILFLSMSRTLHTFLARLLPKTGRNFWFTFLDSHKDIHIMAGKALMIYAGIHVLAHSIGTVPGILQKDVEELNELLGCAQADPPYVAEWDLSFLHWPRCPLRESDVPRTFTEALFLTMPGLTGVLLVLVLLGVGYTSSSRFRAQSFDWFWTFHNFMICAWPLLLFLHGSQGWIGVGIPLVILAVLIPIFFYLSSRIARVLRYYLFVGKHVKILRAIVRPGKDGVQGALTQLEVRAPPYLWSFKPGMYAFICMPEYKKMQWHPFTITSGKEDTSVNFLISGVGDWTQELARRCLLAAEGEGELPVVALDGPYAAATQSATEKKVLVAVGAGVGITPFISLLSTLVAQLSSEQGRHSRLVEAHFYWMTRNPTEFIFGWRLLQKWLAKEVLQAKIFIHLYTTAKDPAKDPCAFLFREAIKKQCVVDRKCFEEYMPHWQEQYTACTPGPEFPWCWAEGGKEDLLWVKCPTFDTEGVAEAFHTITASGYMPSATTTTFAEAVPNPDMQRMIPVIFGRPNFLQEIASIGAARPTENVHVYICGNDAIVKDLQSVCQKCSQHAMKRSEEQKLPLQKYVVHYERFG
mmetsp:Transcript_18909/g.43975  ORF Transcript_18909/g.43975 Transcript_18909/m.43975 type:complete len:955 (+) Transcript_18909:90-2954(+)|eukprot:CAMPEP_0178406560 /NCGR_PEP_ID=MMETSP0689_2-20121128/18975_1 /TAXON_ID=160604 /ORGANISM="Amphidinium massartii, Strain CS-259" /LENGTH=954 /DNA_ID=CAMNT_0020027605 /DNA_START=15 /DNA_END=2879 /DNA_ORIENTATION=-